MPDPITHQIIDGLAAEYASALIRREVAFHSWREAANANTWDTARRYAYYAQRKKVAKEDLYSAWIDALDRANALRDQLIALGREDIAIAILMEHAAKANALDTEATALERIGSRQDATGA